MHGLSIIGTKKPVNGEVKTSASFLANDWDISQDTQTICKQLKMITFVFILLLFLLDEGDFERSHLNDCRVLVWGLNDKDQLGGMKGSKIKIPTYSESLSRLRPIHIAGGSKSLFIVSQSGKVLTISFHYEIIVLIFNFCSCMLVEKVQMVD